MSDLMLHGLGRGSGDSGMVPIEGLTPIIASDEIKGLGLPFAHRSLGTLSDRKGVNHYHNGNVYVLHSLGVTIYDAESGEVVADNAHTTSGGHMTPDLAATDGSYYLIASSDKKLCKYALDGALIWEVTMGNTATCIAVESSGVYVGDNNSSNSKVYKYNRTNGNLIWSSPIFANQILSLAVNSTTVIAADNSSKIKKLNISNGAEVFTYSLPSGNAVALAIEPGTNHFYSGVGTTLRKHSYQTGEPIFQRAATGGTNIFIDGGNNVYTVSTTAISKFDNQLASQIWSEGYNISGNPIYGFGFEPSEGKIYILRQHTARILSTDKEWSGFIPHQFEGTVNSVDIDINSNFYGASDDWSVRKFSALGEEQWLYKHTAALNFVRVDKNGNVYIADTNRNLKKLNPYGIEQWSCSIPNTTGAVTDLVVNSEGAIIVSIAYFHTSGSKDYLVKISPSGILVKTMEIGTSGVFRKLHLLNEHTVLAFNKFYDIDTLRTMRHYSAAKAVFGIHRDFICGIDSTKIQTFNKYSGGQVRFFEVKDINITNFYLRAAQGLDGAVYAWDNDKTLVKFNEKGEEFWRYKAVEKIADIKADEEHNLYLATGFYIEKLTQTFSIKGYDKN